MTVKELIAELQTMPPDLAVCYDYDEGIVRAHACRLRGIRIWGLEMIGREIWDWSSSDSPDGQVVELL